MMSGKTSVSGSISDVVSFPSDPSRIIEGFRESSGLPNICGVEVPIFLLSDSGYALQRNVITPFPHTTNPFQRAFNYRHSATRMAIERAFGRLKRVWRQLGGLVTLHVDMVPHVMKACLILHNLMIDKEVLECSESDSECEDDLELPVRDGGHVGNVGMERDGHDIRHALASLVRRG